MTESKNKNENYFNDDEKQEAPRARNRTVMLSPDVTGEMRSRLAEDFSTEDQQPEIPQTGNILPGRNIPQTTDEFQIPVATGIVQEPSVKVNLSSPAGSGANDQARLNSNFSARPAFESTAKDRFPQEDLGNGTRTPNSMPEPRVPVATQSSIPDSRAATAATPARPTVATPSSTVDQDMIVWDKISPLQGFLVSYDKDPNGQVFEIRNGRLIVSVEATSGGNYLLIKDDSVSPMHAILKVGNNQELQVLDQLSENGTEIRRAGSDEVENLSGEKGIVRHGDVIAFGKRSFHVCLIVKD